MSAHARASLQIERRWRQIRYSKHVQHQNTKRSEKLCRSAADSRILRPVSGGDSAEDRASVNGKAAEQAVRSLLHLSLKRDEANVCGGRAGGDRVKAQRDSRMEALIEPDGFRFRIEISRSAHFSQRQLGGESPWTRKCRATPVEWSLVVVVTTN